MQEALLYTSANQMQKRDAAVVIAKHLPDMSWKIELESAKNIVEDSVDVAQGERILDIGSGSGDVTMSILSQAIPVQHSLTGLDISEQMVEFANNNYGNNNTHFHCMDIAKMENPRLVFPEGFTKLFSFYCLHWVRNLSCAVSNMAELLVPGGEGLVVFLANNPIFKIYRCLAKTTAWREYMKDVEDFIPVYQDVTCPEEQFASILSKAGMKIITCKAIDEKYTFNNKNQVIAAMQAVNPFLSKIPQEKRGEYVKDSLRLLASFNTPTSDGRIEARYKLIIAHFKKP